jgi:hypothetical protein
MWELAVCDVYGLSALTYLGDTQTLGRIVPDSHRDVRERGDLYATANLAFFESFVLLGHDRPEAATDVATRAIEPFPRSKFLAIHYGIAYAVAQAHLYRGRPDLAWELIEREFPAWQSAGMTRVQGARVEISYLRARTAIMLLETRPPSHSTARDRLRKDIARLEAERVGHAAPMAQAIRSGLARLDGDDTQVAMHLTRAADGFENARMTLHAAAARRHLARLHRSTSIPDLPGVASSENMSHLLVPGFRQ